METVTDEDVSKLSKIELRKLKLAEYLAAKGRLKAHNPKPYLKENPVTKKPPENNRKVKSTSDEKENCGISGTNIKEVKTLAEVDKNTSFKKGLNIHSLFKAPAQFPSDSRNAHQAGFHALKTQSNRSASIQDLNKRHKVEKTPASVPAANRTHSQSLKNAQHKAHQAQTASNGANKTHKSTKSKSSLVSVSGPSRSGFGKSRDQTQHTKTDIQAARLLTKKVSEKSVKTNSVANLKSLKPVNTTETKIQTKSVSKTLEKPAQQPRSQIAAQKFGIHTRNSQSNKLTNSRSSRSNVNQGKDVSCITTKVDATKIKSLNKATRTSVSKTQANLAQQPRSQNAVQIGISSQSNKHMNRKSNLVLDRSDVNQRKDISCIITKVNDTTKTRSVLSTQSKRENSEGSVTIKNKPQTTNPTVSAKLLGRITRSCVLPQTTTATQELHQPVKRSSQVKPAVQFQTPKSRLCPSTQGVRTAPVDGRKKPTAAQEERLRKLQEWRETRGITYKRPPMPVRLVRRKTVSAIPQPYWTSMDNEEEVHDIVFAVDRSLDDCIKLLQQGFPAEQVRDVLSRVPMAQKLAKYWICQARLMEREGNLEVLSLFQEAIRVVREPVDELRSVIFQILKKRQIQGLSPVPKESEEAETTLDDKQEVDVIMCTPKPVGALICGMKGDSSVVKYKITATPGGKRSQQGAEPGQVDGHEIRFFTPVRRSVRIEKSALRYPTALQEHDPCVTSLCDLAGETKEEVEGDTRPQSSPVYVYRENEALKDHVQVKLVYPEEADA